MIPYNFDLCRCGHIAHDHLISDGKGNLNLDKCRECLSSAYFILNGSVCLDFKLDNLSYIERLANERNLI